MADLATLARRSPGVYWLEAGEPPAGLPRLARAAGLRLRRVPLGRVADERTLLAALARGLKLPGYFGGNWDALEECLRDLEPPSGAGVLVLLSRCDRLVEAAPAAAETLADVLRGAAAWHQGAGRPALFLLQGTLRPASLRRIPSR